MFCEKEEATLHGHCLEEVLNGFEKFVLRVTHRGDLALEELHPFVLGDALHEPEQLLVRVFLFPLTRQKRAGTDTFFAMTA